MLALYIVASLAAVAMQAIHCEPAAIVCVAAAVLLFFGAELRALHMKARARRLVRRTAPAG